MQDREILVRKFRSGMCENVKIHRNSQNGRFAAYSPFGRSLAPGLDQILKRTNLHYQIFEFSIISIFFDIPIFLWCQSIFIIA